MTDFKNEDVIKQIIINNIKNKFNLNDELLFRYIYSRFILLNNYENNSINKDLLISSEFIKFILDELYIYHNNISCFFLDEEVLISSNFQFSLKAILEDVMFRYQIDYKDYDYNNLISYLKAFTPNIKRFASLKTSKYKTNKKNNKKIYKYFLINKLNKEFNLIPKNINSLQGFKNTTNTLLEDKLLKFFETFFYNYNNHNAVSENDIEEYLIKHFKYIWEDIRIIGRQIKIKEGIIDLLGRDKKGIYYIIELKNNIDERLIWQSIYYPLAFKEQFNIDKENIKMITLSTQYNQSIYDTIQELNNNNFEIIMLNIDINTKNGKISTLNIDKASRPDL